MKWGISLYPEHSTVEQDCAYIERAAAHGFSRIFSCLLSVEGDPDQVKRESAELTSCAHANGMEVVFDVDRRRRHPPRRALPAQPGRRHDP